MNVVIGKGKRMAIVQAGEEFCEEKTGLMTGTRVELVPEVLVPGGLRAVGSPHPVFPGIVVTKRSYRKERGMWRVTYTYEGIPIEDPEWEFYQPVTEIVGGTAEEDIQLHPDFTKLAGTVAEPKNGAKFDKDGRFLGWFGEKAGDLLGVERYLDCACTVTVTQIGKSASAVVANLPSRATPPGAPSLGGGRDWMLVDVQQTRRGTVWETKKVYRASGRSGWNTRIYK